MDHKSAVESSNSSNMIIYTIFYSDTHQVWLNLMLMKGLKHEPKVEQSQRLKTLSFVKQKWLLRRKLYSWKASSSILALTSLLFLGRCI